MDEIITVSEFRDNFSKAMKKVEKGKNIIVTSRGKTIAKISPFDNEKIKAREYFNSIAKKAKIYDILSPLDVEWEAMQ